MVVAVFVNRLFPSNRGLLRRKKRANGYFYGSDQSAGSGSVADIRSMGSLDGIDWSRVPSDGNRYYDNNAYQSAQQAGQGSVASSLDGQDLIPPHSENSILPDGPARVILVRETSQITNGSRMKYPIPRPKPLRMRKRGGISVVQQESLQPIILQQESTFTQKRKPFRAISLLTSIASDFDVISDWMFFYHTYVNRDQVPSKLVLSVFTSCIIGTLLWLVLATDGRLITPLMKCWRIKHVSMGAMLFLCVMFEDIPQVVLTFLVEDYYENDEMLSQMAVCNLCVSLYDTLIKLAEAYDERNDLVETGIWCKDSMHVHSSAVTQALVLPITKYRCSKNGIINTITTGDSASTSSASPKGTKSFNQSLKDSIRTSFGDSPLVDAFLPDEELELPKISFLTTSRDKTIRLWDIASLRDNKKRKGRKVRTYRGHTQEVTCVAWLGHLGSGNGNGYHQHNQQKSGVNDASNASTNEESPHNNGDKNNQSNDIKHNLFLTGCKSGNVKLWKLNGVCIRNFYLRTSSADKGVTAIATVNNNECSDGNDSTLSAANRVTASNQTFISGYTNGVIRLWNIATGICIGEYCGHSSSITSLCYVCNDDMFVSASTDGTLRLWQTKDAIDAWNNHVHAGASSSTGNITKLKRVSPYILVADSAMHREKVSKMTFTGHSGPVLCVTCVDEYTAMLSGAADGTARLWSLQTGSCLRVFNVEQEQTSTITTAVKVTTVTAIDQVTFLTGSSDNKIRAWDALTGTCLRTYKGHKGKITSLSVIITYNNDHEENDTNTADQGFDKVYDDERGEIVYFLSSSADRTVKIWVLTTVPSKRLKESPGATLDDILDLNNTACSCFAPNFSATKQNNNSTAPAITDNGNNSNNNCDTNNKQSLLENAAIV